MTKFVWVIFVSIALGRSQKNTLRTPIHSIEVVNSSSRIVWITKEVDIRFVKDKQLNDVWVNPFCWVSAKLKFPALVMLVNCPNILKLLLVTFQKHLVCKYNDHILGFEENRVTNPFQLISERNKCSADSRFPLTSRDVPTLLINSVRSHSYHQICNSKLLNARSQF